MHKIACIQTSSSDDIASNIAHIAPLAQSAVSGGATLIALPENAFAMRREGHAALSFAPEQHAGVLWAQDFCAAHKIWLLIGSIRALISGHDKPMNQSILVDDQGNIAAQYNKIHLFDVTLPSGERYHESSTMACGDRTIITKTPCGILGLSICYDVRFADMYRKMAQLGAEILCVPSAFTRPTGQAHWEVLLRARAIENLAYVIAPAQAGVHPGGRETYGHSMMIDPWGKIIAHADSDAPQIIMAEIDLAEVAKLRAQFPVLHDS